MPDVFKGDSRYTMSRLGRCQTLCYTFVRSDSCVTGSRPEHGFGTYLGIVSRHFVR